MTEKVKLTREQADALDSFLEMTAGVRFTELFKAIKYGYEVKPEYKSGDWVVYQGVGIPRYCVIKHVDETSVDTDHIGENGYKQTFGKDRIRHATPEEIKAEKERRLWSGIGREVGEFKPDDIGITKDNNTHYRNKPAMLTGLYKSGRLQGFYPAESFVSFKEETE